MGAPEGFGSISPSQAMMEYVKPLSELTEDEGDLNEVLQASMALWNYSISLQKEIEPDQKMRKRILKELRKTFKLGKEEADSLLSKMVKRQQYLFPEEIQPKGTGFILIRKELRYIIRPYDYKKLQLLKEIIPPDMVTRAFIEGLSRLDKNIKEGTDYAQFEDLLFSLKEECETRFAAWFVAKRVGDDPEEFSSCLPLFMDFVYGYMHDDTFALKSVPEIYFVEFFEDFLLRKMMADPPEYILWPPALKLFYQFLYEKEYLDNPKNFTEMIDKIEPYFIEVLKKQFS